MNRDAGDLREMFLYAELQFAGDVVDLGWVAQRLFAVWLLRYPIGRVRGWVYKTTQRRVAVLLGALYLAANNSIVYNYA